MLTEICIPRRTMFRTAVLTLTAFLVFGIGSQAPAYEMKECIVCHAVGSAESLLHVSIDDFYSSAHGESLTCLSCHTDVDDDDHMTVPGSGHVDCGQCHDQTNKHGASGHSDNTPQCYHCHTKHRILAPDNSVSSVFAGNLRNTCLACHPAPCGRTTALSWLPSLKVASHAKQDFSQSYSEDNCIGCHQGAAAHGDRGVLNDQVCYVCHASLAEGPLIAGYMHVSAERPEQPLSLLAGIVYTVVGAVLLFGGIRYWLWQRHAREDS